ncbi:MAG: hypothetical protein AAF481_08375 [Acidobacteriota bacterium]
MKTKFGIADKERGEGRIGCIFWCLVLIVAVMVAWEMVPIKIRSAEFYDFMVDQAAVATHDRSSENIKKRLLNKAHDLDIPLDKKNLSVERIGDRIKMRATYMIPAEFPGYTYEWEFEHEVDRNLYIF